MFKILVLLFIIKLYASNNVFNTRNIFFEKSYPKCRREASPRTFYKKSKFSITMDQHSEMLKSLFLLNVHVEIYPNLFKLRCWPLAFTFHKVFFKKKRGLKLVSVPHFLHDLWRKIILTLKCFKWLN